MWLIAASLLFVAIVAISGPTYRRIRMFNKKHHLIEWDPRTLPELYDDDYDKK